VKMVLLWICCLETGVYNLDTQSVVMKFKITSASHRFKKPGNGS
jgi:hypothetical protein